MLGRGLIRRKSVIVTLDALDVVSKAALLASVRVHNTSTKMNYEITQRENLRAAALSGRVPDNDAAELIPFEEDPIVSTKSAALVSPRVPFTVQEEEIDHPEKNREEVAAVASFMRRFSSHGTGNPESNINNDENKKDIITTNSANNENKINSPRDTPSNWSKINGSQIASSPPHINFHYNIHLIPRLPHLRGELHISDINVTEFLVYGSNSGISAATIRGVGKVILKLMIENPAHRDVAMHEYAMERDVLSRLR